MECLTFKLENAAVEKKMPNPIDVLVGFRIRMRRLLLGLSQERLADGLGITFQQVQKYEKGTNRVGASRLMDIAKILDVAPGFFFQDSDMSLPQGAVGEPGEIASFIKSSEGIALNRAFVKIKDPAVRKKVVALAKALAEQTADHDTDVLEEAEGMKGASPEHRV